MDGRTDENVDLLSELGYATTQEPVVSDVPSLMLSVEDNFGQHWAFSFAHLSRIEFNMEQSRELVLFFPSHRVTVTGYRLGELYRQLCQHRVCRLVEASNEELLTATDGAQVVQHIAVEPLPSMP